MPPRRLWEEKRLSGQVLRARPPALPESRRKPEKAAHKRIVTLSREFLFAFFVSLCLGGEDEFNLNHEGTKAQRKHD
jgi:hypothetical protein